MLAHMTKAEFDDGDEDDKDNHDVPENLKSEWFVKVTLHNNEGPVPVPKTNPLGRVSQIYKYANCIYALCIF